MTGVWIHILLLLLLLLWLLFWFTVVLLSKLVTLEAERKSPKDVRFRNVRIIPNDDEEEDVILL